MRKTRRSFLSQAISTGAIVSSASLISARAKLSSRVQAATQTPLGKAEHCIFIWLGGGACQIDTWDPKQVGDPKTNKAGSAYAAIDTAIPGTQVCEYLPKCARILDRFNIVRTVHHDGFPDHAAASNFVHTGRATTGTIVYPSIGSLVSHCKEPLSKSVPSYVLVGFPSVARGPGFLGPKAGYIYLTDTESGPRGFSREANLTEDRQSRREALLSSLRKEYFGDQERNEIVKQYDEAIDESLKLAGPEFRQVFQLEREKASLREAYGGEFGQRCLLSRRLIQSGARFVEVSHNLNFVNGSGWDTHRQGQLKQHLLIQELDDALSMLVTDLEMQGLLDKTLVVVGTEFGRPASFDGKGGRGHHAKSYSMVLAGGGLNNGVTIGTTDEKGMKIVDRPVSIPDFHATIANAMGIDSSRELYAGERPVPLTDHGVPIAELFA